MTVGEVLSKAREKLGKTQSEIAALLGKTQAAVSEWESDKSLPKTAEVRAVAKVYRVKPEAILPMPADDAA